MRLRAAHRGAGFTLVELSGMIAILAVLSFTALPALSGLNRAGASGDRSAVETLVVLARERAWASGVPHVVRIAPDGVAVQALSLEDLGGEPEPLLTMTGDEAEPRLLRDDGVVAVSGAALGDDGSFEIWFSGSGVPLVERPVDSTGVVITEPIGVEFSSGAVLTVLTRSGVLRW